jgi:hypothetical protein
MTKPTMNTIITSFVFGILGAGLFFVILVFLGLRSRSYQLLALQKAALEVAVRYRQQNGRYHGIDDVLTDLRSEYSHPDITDDAYHQMFDHICPLYDAAVSCIRSHPVADLPRDPKTDIPNLDHLIPIVRSVVDGYSDEIYQNALRWAFFWWILR